MTLRGTGNRVKMNKKLSSNVEVKLGLRHGDPLAKIPFNFVLEKTVREAQMNRTGLFYYKRYKYAFAVGSVIITRNI